MKILHVCLTGGYTEGFTYQENLLIKYQARENNDVYLLSTEYCWNKNVWSKSSDKDYTNGDGVRIIRIPYLFNLPYKLNSYIGLFKGLYNHLEDINPDIIFIHNIQFKDIKAVAKYAKNHKDVKVFVDNHSDFTNSARGFVSRFFLYNLWWKKCARKINPFVEKFYGVLPARVDFLKKVYGLPSDKCELLVMGADDDYVKKYNDPSVIQKTREEYDIKEDDFVIVTGGKIDKNKPQVLSLMETVNSIKHKKVKLFVFGAVDSEFKKKFESLLSDNIVYLGWANSEQAYKYFSMGNLVVFPGRHSVYWEQVVALGKPLICKELEGTNHIDIGGNVIFIKNDNDLKDIITNVINDKNMFNALNKNAQKDDKNMFLYSRISKKSIGEE